jgi:hypothetical protein
VIIAPEDNYQLAKSLNDAGGVAGVLCFISQKTCNAYFATSIPCDEGEKYPIMMNSIAGAMNTQATCTRYGSNKFLVLENMGAVVDAFEDGGEVAFVMPARENKFIVSRFNCVGAKSAIRKATKFVELQPKLKTSLTQSSSVDK